MKSTVFRLAASVSLALALALGLIRFAAIWWTFEGRVVSGNLTATVTIPCEPPLLSKDGGQEGFQKAAAELMQRAQIWRFQLWRFNLIRSTRTITGSVHLSDASGTLTLEPNNIWVHECQLMAPIWYLLVLFGVWPLAVLLPAPLRLAYRRKRGRCLVCGYDLKGNVSGRCPECGTPMASGLAVAESRDRRFTA